MAVLLIRTAITIRWFDLDKSREEWTELGRIDFSSRGAQSAV